MRELQNQPLHCTPMASFTLWVAAPVPDLSVSLHPLESNLTEPQQPIFAPDEAKLSSLIYNLHILELN